MLKRLVNRPWFFWAILALPSIPILLGLADGLGPREAHRLVHPSGEFAARFLIVALALTPLRMLLPKSRFLAWLMARRRAIGVAAFAYALLHCLLYLADKGSLATVLGDALRAGIWTGWIAFFIFVPLAATSNDWSLRLLRRGWKRLQQFVYVAAVLTLAHWLLVTHSPTAALLHFLPLAGLEAYRLWRLTRRRPGRRGHRTGGRPQVAA